MFGQFFYNSCTAAGLRIVVDHDDLEAADIVQPLDMLQQFAQPVGAAKSRHTQAHAGY